MAEGKEPPAKKAATRTRRDGHPKFVVLVGQHPSLYADLHTKEEAVEHCRKTIASSGHGTLLIAEVVAEVTCEQRAPLVFVKERK